MERPTEDPVAIVNDAANQIEMLIYKSHGSFVVYWQREGNEGWQRGPRQYKSVMGAIRAAYVITIHQG